MINTLNVLKHIPSRVYAGILAAGIPFALYLALPNRNYGWDAVEYIQRINSGTLGSLFHPHHLLYNAIGHISLQGLNAIGINVATPDLMQILNSIVALISLVLFYLVLLMFTRKVLTAAVFTLLLGFTNVIWEYSVEVEVYIFGLVFLIASLLIITRYLSGDKKPGIYAMLGLGLLGSLACLIHQMHILFALVIMIFIILVGANLKARIKMAALYATPMVLVVGGTYAAVGFAMGLLPNIASFLHWILMYFNNGSWGHATLKSIPLAAYGLQKVFMKASFLRDWLITGEINTYGIIFMVLFVIAVIILFSLMAVTIWKFRRIFSERRNLIIILSFWILAYAIFVFWWDPLTHELWMPVVLPFWLLVLLAWEQWGVKFKYKFTLLVTLMILFLAVNIADIIPNSKIENNEVYQLTAKLNQQDPGSGSMLLVYGSVPVAKYSEVFFNSRITVTSLNRIASGDNLSKEEALGKMASAIESTLEKGGRVFVSHTEINPGTRESLAILGETRIMKIADYIAFYNQYSDRMEKIFTYQWRKQTTWIYEIIP